MNLREWPDLSEQAKDVVRVRLGAGCQCGHSEAALVRRRIASGATTVVLQCTACGYAIGGGPMKLAEHPNHTAYPEWDAELQDQWREAGRTQREERQAQWMGGAPERRAEYQQFLATSAEWRVLRGKVMRRANMWCEACLNAPAQHVHHTISYQHGRLPPAWLLRAVCEACHSRLHADEEWCGA